MSDELRDKVARMLNLIAYAGDPMRLSDMYSSADELLALPEIREALEARAASGSMAANLHGVIKSADALKAECAEARAALAAAQAREAALVEWARKSGHRAGCDALRNWERDCDCGLRALLASPAPEVKP